MEAVSDIIAARAREPQGLRRMAVASLALHAVAGVVVILGLPNVAPTDSEPKTVMQISLGGAPGKATGGMTQLGRTAVQAPAPPEPLKRAPTPTPIAKAPEMSLPAPKAKVVPRPTVKEAPPEARGTKPVTGAQPRSGTALTETGATGQGFGLSSGGGGATSGFLDVGDFCCPDYLTTMAQLIQRNWNGHQQVAGQTQVRFTILRDGRITDVAVEKPSGYFALDQTAERALLLTRQLPPLPAQYTETQLTVHLIFRYDR